MNLFPAIDVRGGKVVRLFKGDFAEETVYDDDPVAVAKSFEDAGAQWVHVVDLDAAKTGEAKNLVVIASIARALTVAVQSGGGVRDYESALALLDAGVQRIVIGTAAHEKPELVERLAGEFPSCIAVGLDARKGVVATRGWVEGAGVTTLELVRRFEHVGVAAFIVTDIERDGTLDGPDVSGLTEILAATSVDVIASGGVGGLDDLRKLAAVRASGKGLAGVIAGKAIYEGKFSVAEAVAVLAETHEPQLEEVLALARPEILRLNGYSSARTEGKQTDIRVFLDANENPYPPYPGDETVANYNRYPQVQPVALRATFAKRYGVLADWLFLSRGADEAIDLLTRVFCSEGKDAVLLTSPGFPMYEHSARVQGAQVVDVPLTAGTYQLDVPALLAAKKEHGNVKLVMVASPNNPTGNLLRRHDLLALASAYRGQALLVVDELYLDYSQAESLATEIENNPNIVVLRSLSKEHSLAGERIGITIAHPTIIGLLNRVSAPYLLTQSSIQAATAVASAEGEAYSRRNIAMIVAERERIRGRLSTFAAVRRVFPSDANFLLVQFENPKGVVSMLEGEGIKVRDRSFVSRLEGCVRISIGTHEENEQMLRVVEKFSS